MSATEMPDPPRQLWTLEMDPATGLMTVYFADGRVIRQTHTGYENE